MHIYKRALAVFHIYCNSQNFPKFLIIPHIHDAFNEISDFILRMAMKLELHTILQKVKTMSIQ